METALSRPARGSRRSLIFAITALVAVVAVSVALLLRLAHSQPPAYRRFVSTPLPDGSRFTFLYPAHLKNVRELKGSSAGAPGVIAEAVAHTQNQTRSEGDLLRHFLGLPALSPGESVSVLVEAVKPHGTRDRRWSDQWARGVELRRNEFLVDTCARVKLSLYHSCPVGAPAQFQAHHPTVGPSLQVLPPGAAIPQDAPVQQSD